MIGVVVWTVAVDDADKIGDCVGVVETTDVEAEEEEEESLGGCDASSVWDKGKASVVAPVFGIVVPEEGGGDPFEKSVFDVDRDGEERIGDSVADRDVGHWVSWLPWFVSVRLSPEGKTSWGVARGVDWVMTGMDKESVFVIDAIVFKLSDIDELTLDRIDIALCTFSELAGIVMIDAVGHGSASVGACATASAFSDALFAFHSACHTSHFHSSICVKP